MFDFWESLRRGRRGKGKGKGKGDEIFRKESEALIDGVSLMLEGVKLPLLQFALAMALSLCVGMCIVCVYPLIHCQGKNYENKIDLVRNFVYSHSTDPDVYYLKWSYKQPCIELGPFGHAVD